MKKSHYQKSQLITNDYLGCELGDKYYRENNVVKMNRLLCKAMNRGHSVYLYELLDNPDLEELTEVLHELKSQEVFYARMSFDHKVLLVILTDKGADFALGVVNSVSTDYTLIYQNSLNADDTDLEEVAFNLYQLCIHVPDTFSHKAKRFSSSSLADADKNLSLVFKKQGVIQTQ